MSATRYPVVVLIVLALAGAADAQVGAAVEDFDVGGLRVLVKRRDSTQTVVAGPQGMKLGNVIYPYEKAKQ